MAILKNLDVPFSNNVLEQKASELIRHYACQRKWTPCFPIPIDSIIEHTLNLCIEYDMLNEAPGTKVWGCIEPGRKTITLNQNYVETFEDCPGLERFTLGHEVGHWIMHVDQCELSQISLFEPSHEVIVCRDGDHNTCEQVANRFSSFVLMPKDLMMIELTGYDVTSSSGFRNLASKIKVSNSALHFRLNKLGIKHFE